MGVNDRVCAVVGCGRRAFAAQHCQMHYARLRAGQSLVTPPHAPRADRVFACPVCGVQWCRVPGVSRTRVFCSPECLSEGARERGLARSRDIDPGLADRERQIIAMRAEGALHREIAARFGLTPGRVGQILKAAAPEN